MVNKCKHDSVVVQTIITYIKLAILVKKLLIKLELITNKTYY